MQQVYLIESNTAVKIGISENVLKRFFALQTSNSDTLNLIGVFDYIGDGAILERALHIEFKKYRIRGEWFNKSIISIIKNRYLLKNNDKYMKYINSPSSIKNTTDIVMLANGQGYAKGPYSTSMYREKTLWEKLP